MNGDRGSMSIQVRYAQGEPPISCASIAEMDAALDRLHAETADELRTSVRDRPLQVDIEFSFGCVATGLGIDKVPVMVSVPPFDDFYCAVDDRQAAGDDTMFFGASQDSYWPPKNLLPIAVAREAVRYFVMHQRRSPNLLWQC